MENIFTSTKFCRDAINTSAKVLILGVDIVYDRGTTPLVYQMEKKNLPRKKDIAGELKGEALKRHSTIINLLALPMRDTKPVYVFANCIEKVAWTSKKRNAHDY